MTDRADHPEAEAEKLAKACRMAKAMSTPPAAPPEWHSNREWPLRHKRAGDRRVHATARFVVNDTQRIWTACEKRVGKGGQPMNHMPVDCRACREAVAAASAAVVPAADRATLRNRIAEKLADADGWRWAPGFRSQSPAWQDYLRRADAVLSVLPAPADRAAVLAEVAAECDKAGGLYAQRGATDAAGAAFALMETFLRKAAEAEYVAAPCSVGGCEPGGEPCSTHERLMAHAEGDHELCAPDCAAVPAVGVAADTTPAEPDRFEWIIEHCPMHGCVEPELTVCCCEVVKRLRAEATPGPVVPAQPGNDTKPCGCPHPADEHSVYGCADGCGCEWMPRRTPQ